MCKQAMPSRSALGSGSNGHPRRGAVGVVASEAPGRVAICKDSAVLMSNFLYLGCPGTGS